MYHTLEEARDELGRIIKGGKNVLESVCTLTTFKKQGQIGNKLALEVIYVPVFSKQDSDDIKRKVDFARPEKEKAEEVKAVPEQKNPL